MDYITIVMILSKQKISYQWFKGTDTVFHVAAKAGMGGRYETYRQANFIATEYLLQACQEFGVSRFIYTSTPSVAFSTSQFGEAMNPCPILERFSPYASTKALAEQAVLAAHHPNGMRTIALRPHLIWGEGDPSFTSSGDIEASFGETKDRGDGENLVDITHLDNVVHAHLCAFRSMVAKDDLGGNAYFIGQNEPVALWKWLNEIFLALGLPILERSISFTTAYRLGFVIEGIWNFFNFNNDPPMTRFVASQLAHDHWFSTAAA